MHSAARRLVPEFWYGTIRAYHTIPYTVYDTSILCRRQNKNKTMIERKSKGWGENIVSRRKGGKGRSGRWCAHDPRPSKAAHNKRESIQTYKDCESVSWCASLGRRIYEHQSQWLLLTNRDVLKPNETYKNDGASLQERKNRQVQQK